MDYYWVFFAGSLDVEPEVEPEPLLELDGELDEPELDGELDEPEPELEGELDEPEPEVLESLDDEPELEDEGEDGAGVGVEPMLLLLELEEPDDDGEDGVVALPLVLPLPDVLPEAPGPVAPRSQAAIRLAPKARETATARVESFMYCLLEVGLQEPISKLRAATGALLRIRRLAPLRVRSARGAAGLGQRCALAGAHEEGRQSGGQDDGFHAGAYANYGPD